MEDIRNHNQKQLFFRNAFIGALDLFNRNMKIEQITNENGTAEATMHEVPFYPHMAQDEQFMKDFFINYDRDCRIVQYAEGNYDIAPKGVIKFESYKIKESELTNKFVRGTYKEVEYDDNKNPSLKANSAYLMSLPMDLSFTGELFADNLGQAFALAQALTDTFYKNNVFYFQHEGIRIPAGLGISEDSDIEKKTEFTYTDNQKVRVKFSFNIETYYPSFDKETKIFKGNTIRTFIANYEETNETPIETTVTTPTSHIFPAGNPPNNSVFPQNN